MQLTLEEVLNATKGECLNPENLGKNFISNISTDTRQITRESLFVPLRGERFDGHDFIETAYKQGALATLTEEAQIPVQGLCTIKVSDTKKALGDIAHYYRMKFNIPLIAVTGSVGKTSTKDLIASVLGAKFKVHKTQGNFNNDIGLPLTLLQLDETHQIAVIEMGMNHFKEISYLSQLAKPDIAVITNIGVSHIENLGSREGILKAKLEVLEGLKENGLLIVNGDDDLLSTVKYPKLLNYGKQDQHAYHLADIKAEGDIQKAKLITPQDTYDITLNALGEHMLYNGLAAVAIAEYFDLNKQQILEGFLSYTSSGMRMHKIQTDNGLTIINDAYNASPDSMQAALKVLEGYQTNGKKIAVLGDMFEMGEFATFFHQQVGEIAAQTKIDCLCTIGSLAENIYKQAKEKAEGKELRHYMTKEAFIVDCHNFLHTKDVILFKASRGMHFEKIVEVLRKVNLNEK